MINDPLEDTEFECLLSDIIQTPTCPGIGLNRILNNKGKFTALQSSRLIYAQVSPAYKIEALELLGTKLCRMTCSEARDILNCFMIGADKLKALNIIKRYLLDSERIEGIEFILSCFVFEKDKQQSLKILKTVRSDTGDLLAAGAHQGYAGLGSLYSQSRPLKEHTYGDLTEQRQFMPGGGKITLPVLAQPDLLPSQYNGHPSYAYTPPSDYAKDRNFNSNIFSNSSMFQKSPNECTTRPPIEYQPNENGGDNRFETKHQQGFPVNIGFVNDETDEMMKVRCI